MVFSKPTELDLVNSDRYSFERQKLLFFNYYLRLHPHIFSHIIVEIRFNRSINLGGIDPIDNIYVVLRSTRDFCRQVHCQMYYPRGKKCELDTNPMVFKSGNSDLEACHAACFALYGKTKIKDEKNEEELYYRAPFTRFSENQNCCLLAADQYYSLGADDFNRTDVHTTPRIDTIGTGFDLDDQPYVDLEGNETFRFKMNKYYCDDFQLEFHGNQCKPSIGEQIFGFLVSSLLYKSCQYGVRYATTHVSATDVQRPQLPPVKRAPPPSEAEWLANVNPNAYFFNPDLTLADLGITGARLKHMIFTTEYGWPGRLVEPLIVYQSVGGRAPSLPPSDVMTVDYVALNKNKLAQFQTDSYGVRLTDEYDIVNIYRAINENAVKKASATSTDGNSSLSDEVYHLFDSLVAISRMATSSELITAIAVSTAQTFITKHMIGGLEQLHLLLHNGESFLSKTLVHLTERAVVKSMLPILLKPALKLVALSVKMMASVLKTTSAVADVVAMIDLLELVHDFFNMNKLGDDGMIKQYSIMDIESRRKAYGYGSVEYTPLQYITVMEGIQTEKNGGTNNKNVTNVVVPPASPQCSRLTPAKAAPKWAITADQVSDRYDFTKIFLWSSTYLYSLKNNSNNLPINWNEEYALKNIDHTEFFSSLLRERADSYQNYNQYIASTLKKVKLMKYGLPAAIATSVIFAFISAPLAILVLMFFSSIVVLVIFSPIDFFKQPDDLYSDFKASS